MVRSILLSELHCLNSSKELVANILNPILKNTLIRKASDFYCWAVRKTNYSESSHLPPQKSKFWINYILLHF
jgi:hypothetical protein